MIRTPYRFEANLSDQEFQKIGQLSLRWSHTEHVIGNCLRVMLRLTEDEARLVVFPMSLEQRLQKISDIAELNGLNENARAALDELKPIMKGIQFVRNNVIHAIVIDDDAEGHLFHLRSKGRTLTKAEVLSTEELTNYAGHVTLALRFALGGKDDPGGHVYTLPDRPEIPEFLRSTIQFPKPK